MIVDGALVSVVTLKPAESPRYFINVHELIPIERDPDHKIPEPHKNTLSRHTLFYRSTCSNAPHAEECIKWRVNESCQGLQCGLKL
jgi:hypothetical protein